MNRKWKDKSGWIRGGVSALLLLAILLGICAPAGRLQAKSVENPLEDESIREITVLEVGETLENLNPILVPDKGTTGDPVQTGQTKPKDTTQSTEPTQVEDPEEGEEGNDDGNQGAQGGQEGDAALGVMLTWYEYGTSPRSLLATTGPVADTVPLSRLKDQKLKYALTLEGTQKKQASITAVTVAWGDDTPQTIGESGTLPVALPEGTTQQTLTFLVTARVGKEDPQEATFSLSLNLSELPDLELRLAWTQNQSSGTASCFANRDTVFSIHNTDTSRRTLSYTAELLGELADTAQITQVSCLGNGQAVPVSGEMEVGAVTLTPTPSTDTGEFTLMFTARVDEADYFFTFNVAYQETLDARLEFRYELKTNAETRTLYPGGTTTISVKNNQLSAGGIAYSMKLTGADGEDGLFQGVQGWDLEESGRIILRMPQGESAVTHSLKITYLVKGQYLTFTVNVEYSYDVRLAMSYLCGGGERQILCETGGTVTAKQPVYTDELTDDRLPYTFSLQGAAEGADFTEITCYQSGTGRRVACEASGEVTLHTENGKTGENQFTVKAKDGAGNQYQFTVNIPYKPRGTGTIVFDTSLKDGDVVENGVANSFWVAAWSVDDSGNRTPFSTVRIPPWRSGWMARPSPA